MALVLGEVLAVNHIPIWWLLLAIPIGVIIKITTKRHIVVYVVIFLFLIIGFLCADHAVKLRDSVWSEHERFITCKGQVGKIAQTKLGFSVNLENTIVENDSFENSTGKNIGRIIVYLEEKPICKIGNMVRVKGTISQFEPARNYGNFDTRNYYMSLGIFAKIKADSLEIVDGRFDGLRQYLYDLKQKMMQTLKKICASGGLAGVCNGKDGIYAAILLGEKADLDEDVRELYSTSGIAHILAISGLHISFIGVFLYGMLRKKFKFAVSASVSILIVIFFGILSGMGIATIRAVTMFGLRILGEVLGRIYDALTAICTAGCLLLLWNPFVIYHSGFQMSFIAIIGIILMWPKVRYVLSLKKYETDKSIDKNTITEIEKKRERNRKIKATFIESLVFSVNTSLFMAPIIAYSYSQLPSFSLLLNIVVIPLMSVVILSGVVGIALGTIINILGTIAILPGSIVLEIYSMLCNVVGEIPFSNIVVGKPSVEVVVGIYIFYIIFVMATAKLKHFREKKIAEQPIDAKGKSYFKQKKKSYKQMKLMEKKFRRVTGAVAIILVVVLYFRFFSLNVGLFGWDLDSAILHRGIFEICFIDVGQGDGILMHTPDGTNITIDGGSTTVQDVAKNRITPYLKARCYPTIDYAFLTHADEDHISGIQEIMEGNGKDITIRNLVLNYAGVLEGSFDKLIGIAKTHNVNIMYIKKGDKFTVGGVSFECLHPDRSFTSSNVNDLSTVMNVSYGDFSMLLTGDLTSSVEGNLEGLLAKPYTVLKVGHHGSKYSTSDEFLAKVKPRLSILSAGKRNRYGHPSKEVVEKLEKTGSHYIRTDWSGGITITTDGKEIKYKETIIK